jgi:hypothetical protein
LRGSACATPATDVTESEHNQTQRTIVDIELLQLNVRGGNGLEQAALRQEMSKTRHVTAPKKREGFGPNDHSPTRRLVDRQLAHLPP